MTTATKTQPITAIRKTIDLAQFKAMDEEGDGTFKGHCSVTGNLDDTGDIFPAGAYESLDELAGSGWICGDHSWGIASEAGIILTAREDSTGLYIEAEFHSDEESQSLRQKIRKRLLRGKATKMSIGFKPTKEPIIIYPSQYERELPKYLKPGFLREGLAKAMQFPYVRILPKIKVFEASVVSVPANSEAAVLSAKSAATVSPSAPSNWQHEIRLARIQLIQLRTKQRLGQPLTESEARTWRVLDLKLKAIDRAAFGALVESRQAQKDELMRRVERAKKGKK